MYNSKRVPFNKILVHKLQTSNMSVHEVYGSKNQYMANLCKGHCPMIYSYKFIPLKLAYFNNCLATAAMVPFLSDFSGSFCYSSINR